MAVRKFHSVEEMDDERWYEPNSPEHLQALKYVWDVARATNPRRFPPGVYKHRTIEDAQAQRQAWEDEHIAAWQAGLQKGDGDLDGH